MRIASVRVSGASAMPGSAADAGPLTAAARTKTSAAQPANLMMCSPISCRFAETAARQIPFGEGQFARASIPISRILR